MSSDGQSKSPTAVPEIHVGQPLVSRSVVPTGKEYGEYRQHLRYDFFYSCAYCTMSEAEAQAIRFAIDHYESRKARPDLEHEYSNLMYACDECNVRKGDRCPPAAARVDGYRFFRPDEDIYADHFEKDGIRLKPKTNAGYYSIEALDLNRQSLRRLREIRERLSKCDRLALAGVMALRSFKFDQLPQNIKGSAARAIAQATAFANQIPEEIDSILRSHARSELVDPEPDSESRAKERATKLRQLQAIYPDSWRAPRGK